ncbi:unnamed protein product [Lymnaea stagnalis]|uniref:Sm domain-containing protein n=1 Tax=Lymnaea stagnalis TaxID=6523 RepID=A0AAV2I054_LYMST
MCFWMIFFLHNSDTAIRLMKRSTCFKNVLKCLLTTQGICGVPLFRRLNIFQKGSGDTIGIEERRATHQKLEQWLNKSMRIKMTDGRTLIGTFLCTDCDCNIIMGSCEEYLKSPDLDPREDPRILGLAMIPGKHVVTIEIDESVIGDEEESESTRNNSNETNSSGLDNAIDGEKIINVQHISMNPS